MFQLLLICPILFSFLYQLSFVNNLNLTYFKLQSRCDYCYQRLKFKEMVPVLSFLLQKGKTKCCHRKLSYCYLVGEILAIFPAFFALQYTPMLTIDFTSFLLIYLFLLVFALYDLATLSIPIHLLFIFTICICILVPMHFISFFTISSLLHLIYWFSNKAIGYGDILLFSILSLALPFIIFSYLFLFTFIIGGGYALLQLTCFKIQNKLSHLFLLFF